MPRWNPYAARHARPRTPDELWNWLVVHMGVVAARTPVCTGHQAPFDVLCCWQFDRPKEVLTLGSRGAGKAQPMDSMVQTISGPVPMGAIRRGDMVCTPHGTVTSVVAVHPQGTKDVYRVTFRDGDSVECCDDHLWEVETSLSSGRRTLLMDTNYLMGNLRVGRRGDLAFSIKLPRPIGLYSPPRADMIPAYTMGVLLGDGGFRGSGVVLTSADREIVERVEGQLHGELQMRHYGGYTHAIAKPYRGKFANDYKDELVRCGLWGHTSLEKFIPADYLFASVEDRWELLRGLMDTDGTVSERGNAVYYSSSPRLAQDAKWLVESLGGIARISEKPTTHETCYRLGIRLPDATMAFHLARKKSRVVPRTKYFPRRMISDVQHVSKRECQCITVSAADGLYLTDHCVVTHNSFFTAIDTHLCSRFEAGHETRILGGAKSQAQQVLSGFKQAVFGAPVPEALSDADTIRKPGVERILYHNGSEVAILTASETSVRGPHVPTLRMDEVDEIEPDLQEAAYGMVMEKHGFRPMISKTSTWHNFDGPMDKEIQKARANNERRPGSHPFFTFCIWEVLERCPESISGPNLENCPACPLQRYCHEDKDEHGGVPKAKRSNGHYTIESAIQKVQGVSTRTFEADYLCRGVKVDGLWFTDFAEARNVTPEAEFDPAVPVQFALDTGLHTGGVWFQVHHQWRAGVPDVLVKVFADYYAEHLTPAEHLDGFPGEVGRAAIAGIKPTGASLCGGRFDKRWTDPAGQARNAIGSVTLGEWASAGMSFDHWPSLAVRDGLTLIENLVKAADGQIRLLVHPRCRHLIRAFATYRRASRQHQWTDEPADPQHPAEDIMDALRGGLVANFPEGRRPQPNFQRKHASRVF